MPFISFKEAGRKQISISKLKIISAGNFAERMQRGHLLFSGNHARGKMLNSKDSKLQLVYISFFLSINSFAINPIRNSKIIPEPAIAIFSPV